MTILIVKKGDKYEVSSDVGSTNSPPEVMYNAATAIFEEIDSAGIDAALSFINRDKNEVVK